MTYRNLLNGQFFHLFFFNYAHLSREQLICLLCTILDHQTLPMIPLEWEQQDPLALLVPFPHCIYFIEWTRREEVIMSSILTFMFCVHRFEEVCINLYKYLWMMSACILVHPGLPASDHQLNYHIALSGKKVALQLVAVNKYMDLHMHIASAFMLY